MSKKRKIPLPETVRTPAQQKAYERAKKAESDFFRENYADAIAKIRRKNANLPPKERSKKNRREIKKLLSPPKHILTPRIVRGGLPSLGKR